MNSASLPHQPEHTFNGLGIAPKILDILTALKFTVPTPIQYKAIPSAIEGKDVVGVAQTGTGKTLAFGIPMLQRLVGGDGKGLILLPTRELAVQVEETLSKIGRPLGLRTAVFIGGAAMGPQIKRIIAVVPKERQTMLFSATLSREIMELATGHMKLPTRIEVAPSGTTSDKVSQEFFIVRKDEKLRLLEKILGDYRGSTLVFSRTKHGARKIMSAVRGMGHKAAEIHGNRSLSQRRDALEGFKEGRYRVLVATDIASRGIDVKGIELVINYDLPTESADYVHPIGRTARAGAEGRAISFAEPQQRREIRDIERLIKKTVPVRPLPALPPSRALSTAPFDEDRPRRFAPRRPASFSHSRPQSRPSFSRSSGPRRPQRSFSRGSRV